MADRQFVGKYQVKGTLPAGRAMAAYTAVDPAGAPVTVKLLRPLDRERFFALMRDLSTVRHPNVARVLDWGVDGDECYVVSEPVEGTDLASLAAARPQLAPSVVAELGAQAAAALAALHGRGILHGGVTPLAMTRSSEGVLVLTDAGLAPAAGQADLSDLRPARERLLREPRGGPRPRPDAPVGRLLARRESVRAGHRDRPLRRPERDGRRGTRTPEAPPSRHVGCARTFPRSLEHVILHAMAKQPEQRHGSAEELRQDLERAAAGMRVAAPAPEPVAGDQAEAPGLALGPRAWGWSSPSSRALWLSGTFAGSVTVPDLTGLTLDEARGTLSDVGLELGDLSSGEAAAGTPEGTVIGQTPAAGEEVDEGSTVDLVVAGAPDVVMPDLIGLSQADAEAAVAAAGLVVERVLSVYSNDVPAGQVADQTPAAGTTVPGGDAGDDLRLGRPAGLAEPGGERGAGRHRRDPGRRPRRPGAGRLRRRHRRAAERHRAGGRGDQPEPQGRRARRAGDERHDRRLDGDGVAVAVRRRAGRLRSRQAKPARRASSSGSPSL